MPRGGRTSGTRHGNGAGMGEGWGGPPKGESQHAPAAASFEPGNEIGGAPATLAAQRGRNKAARSEALEDHLEKLATTARDENTQVQAAAKLHAIWNGQPVARNLNATVDDVSQLSDAGLQADLDRLAAIRIAAEARDASPPVPGGSDDLVH